MFFWAGALTLSRSQLGSAHSPPSDCLQGQRWSARCGPGVACRAGAEAGAPRGAFGGWWVGWLVHTSILGPCTPRRSPALGEVSSGSPGPHTVPVSSSVRWLSCGFDHGRPEALSCVHKVIRGSAGWAFVT